MNIYLKLILVFYIGTYLIELITDLLNLAYITPNLPDEFKPIYKPEKYRQSQLYLIENTRFSIFESTLQLLITIPFILFGGFNVIDLWVRSLSIGPIMSGLLFFGCLLLLSQLMSLPFSIYHTFSIEERFGFNKTKPTTFILDLLKSFGLTILLGGSVLALVLWFFETTGPSAWLFCWGFTFIFQLIIMWVTPTIIMPLFNKFTPLKDGDLKNAIENLAKSQQFPLQGIYTMDGSKRSSKSNAFFTGFGKNRRIVLYDTLIEKHTTRELCNILAHEIGHYKKNHIKKMLVLSFILSGITFAILSLMLNNPGLFDAFKMENISIYASLVFFGFIYSPVNFITSIFTNALSRRHEEDADIFAVNATDDPEGMILALKKLGRDNLSNLFPHPLKILLDYSHPPIAHRIIYIRHIFI